MRLAEWPKLLVIGGAIILLGLFTWIAGGTAAAIESGAGARIGDVESAVSVTPVTEEKHSYMPAVYERWPPIPLTPTLHAIENGDGDGDYTVAWTTAYLADSYQLQEDDNAGFSSPVTRYSGANTSTWVSGRPSGTWFYRVRGCNQDGCSPWSNTQSATVRPPMSRVFVANDTGGDLCYEVQGTGIGNKCFPGGTHLYGEFPPGTYRFCASGWCGSVCDTRSYPSGTTTHRFWCGASSRLAPDGAGLGVSLLVGPE